MSYPRRLALLPVVVIAAACPNTTNRDADGDAEVDRGEGDEGVADVDTPDVWDGDGEHETAGDADGDVQEEAEGWDFGGDLWDPMRACDAAAEDPAAWVAPSCGTGCRQVAFAAQPRGVFAPSERWLLYESLRRTWYVDLTTADEAVLFCHPSYVGSYAIAVDGGRAVFAFSTHFPVDSVEIAYASLWVADLSSRASRLVSAWMQPLELGRTWLTELTLSGPNAVLTKYDVVGSDPSSWLPSADIFLVETATDAVTCISDLGWPCCVGWTDIGGDWAVYSTTNAVLAYNLVTGTTIGRDIPGDQFWPRTDGVNVVWLDHRNYPGGYGRGGSWDIYSYNFVTETEIRITSPTNPVPEDAAPDLLGDVIVWSDRRNATAAEPHHADLFMYRYSTGREQQLTFESGAARWPRLANGAVYFLWAPDAEPDPDSADRALCEQILPDG